MVLTQHISASLEYCAADGHPRASPYGQPTLHEQWCALRVLTDLNVLPSGHVSLLRVSLLKFRLSSCAARHCIEQDSQCCVDVGSSRGRDSLTRLQLERHARLSTPKNACALVTTSTSLQHQLHEHRLQQWVTSCRVFLNRAALSNRERQ